MLLKQGHWISKTFTIIIYLKIENYIQLKIHNFLLPVVRLIHGTTERIRSFQYIYSKNLKSFIKTVFENKSNS